MRLATVREYVAIGAISGSGSMSLLLPLYLNHLGYPLVVIGLLAGLGGIATLLSRAPVPVLYRPERSTRLLIVTSVFGAVSATALPYLPELATFTVLLFLNRGVAGIANSVNLARYIDGIGEGADRRRAMGFYGGALAGGYTVCSLFTGLLADFFGYPAAFLFVGSLSLLAAACLIGAPTPVISARSAARAGQAPRPAGIRGWLSSLADPGLWGVLNTANWNNLFHTILIAFFPVLGVAVGLSAGQVGVARAVFAGVNAVGRPAAGIVMSRLSLRQVGYLGLGLQSVLLFALPFARDFWVFLLISLVSGIGRAIVVVAGTAGLAEDVDETRVSRGLGAAAYSTASDIPHTVGPTAAGFVAASVGVAGMFPIMAVVLFAGFVGGDLAVAYWRSRRAAEAARLAPSEVPLPQQAR